MRTRKHLVRFVGLQPTVIASRAPHLLPEQSVMKKIRKIVDVHRPSRLGESANFEPHAAFNAYVRLISLTKCKCLRKLSVQLLQACRFTTYRHRFARAAPAPRAKRNESWTCIARGRASPVNFRHLLYFDSCLGSPGFVVNKRRET